MIFSYCRHSHGTPNLTAPALDVQGLYASYGSKEIPAIKGIDLSISVGSCIALVGANGAGKSTLFKVLSGLLPVQKGHVRIFGHPLGVCHHRVVYLPQRSEIDWQFPVSALDLVLTGRYVYLGWFKGPSMNDQEIALSAMQQLGVKDLALRQISELSGGQQQRLLIARALAQNADLLLLDEPLNAVDAQTRHIVDKALQDLKLQGKTVVVATHYYNQEEHRYDGVIYLQDGEKVDVASPNDQHKDCC